MLRTSESIRISELIKKIVVHTSLLVGGIIVASPLIWMFLSSVRPMSEFMKEIVSLRLHTLTLENYIKIYARMPVGKFMINSTIVTIVPVVIILFTSSFVGYIFAKHEFKGKNILFLAVIGTMMVPFYAYVISLYQLVINLGWGNTYYGIFGPWVVDAFGIFLMKQVMEGIPNELIESAKIDGASEGWIYFRIMLPLSKTGLGALVIFYFLWHWNSLFWPLIIITERKMFTMSVGIASLMGMAERYPETTQQFALAALAILPVIVVFLAGQKTFTRSDVLTGLKL